MVIRFFSRANMGWPYVYSSDFNKLLHLYVSLHNSSVLYFFLKIPPNFLEPFLGPSCAFYQPLILLKHFSSPRISLLTPQLP